MSAGNPALKSKIRPKRSTFVHSDGFESFCSELRTALAQRCGPLWATPISFEVTVSGPSALSQNIDHMRGVALIANVASGLADQVAYLALDTLTVQQVVSVELGGDPDEATSAGREASTIDAAICRRFCEGALGSLGEVVAARSGELRPENLSLNDFQSGATLPPRVTSESEVLWVRIGLRFAGVAESGAVHFIIPVATIGAALEKLSAAGAAWSTGASTDWSRMLLKSLLQVPMPIRSVLHVEKTHVADLTQLEVGQVIPLEAASLANVAMCAQVRGRREVIARGRLGGSKGRKAVQITEGPSETFLAPLRNRMLYSGD